MIYLFIYLLICLFMYLFCAEGEFTSEAIVPFVLENKLPLIITYSDETSATIFGGDIKKQVRSVGCSFVTDAESSLACTPHYHLFGRASALEGRSGVGELVAATVFCSSYAHTCL